MAIGPCGISVGVTDHGLWAGQNDGAPQIRPLNLQEGKFHALGVKPPDKQTTDKQTEDKQNGVHAVEGLALGNWVGISGAAFTTGLGKGTSLGKSLLLGMANIRLGYWWNSGIRAEDRSKANARTKPSVTGGFAEFFSKTLIVQSHLLNEFLGQFHGPVRRRWYLSDGGHFDNTACYELVRRRVPFILCVDSGQDLSYDFEDVANLVRLVRTDFQAEVEFYRRAENGGGMIGNLGEFLPTHGEPDDLPSKQAKAHAVLARVHFPDHEAIWILFLKPSVSGDEPLDVRQYQDGHPEFPQQTTADQYFDEAQWESYRKLGEHIGLLVSKEMLDKDWAPQGMQRA
jgi:hypothetical protein